MIRIFIADDDFLIRSNIKLLIGKISKGISDLQYEIVGEAANGEEAWGLLENIPTDIVVSDVRMPKIDGLQLLNNIKNSNSAVQVIMLSSYDDYDYVREALRNGAVDYILKHKLTVTTLKDALEKAVKNLEEQQHTRYDNVSSMAALKRDFIMKLMTGFYTRPEEVLSRINVLNLSLGKYNILPVIMMIQKNDFRSTMDAYTMENTVVSIIDEILHDMGSGICCHVSDVRFIILLSFENIFSEKKRKEIYNSVIRRISICLNNYIKMQASFFDGSIADNMFDIKNAYSVAEQKYENRYYERLNNNVANNKQFDIMTIYGIKQERALLSAVRGNDYDETKKIICEIFDELKLRQPSLAESQIVFTDILGIISRICKERDIDVTRIYGEQMTPQAKFNEFTSIDIAQEWFEKIFSLIINIGDETNFILSSEHVSGAVKYIHKHYNESISLTMVASAIGISPAYLSKVFKEELGIGFVKYLNTHRMEIAKKLLECPQHNIKTISNMCGFNDEAYFSNAFRKHTGMSPNKFKKYINK